MMRINIANTSPLAAMLNILFKSSIIGILLMTFFISHSAYAAVAVDTDGNYSVTNGNNASYKERVNGGTWSSGTPAYEWPWERTNKSTGIYEYAEAPCTEHWNPRLQEMFLVCSNTYTTMATVYYVIRTPSQISATSFSSSGTLSVSWSGVSGSHGYELQQRKGSGSWTTVYSGTATSSQRTGLASAKYQYRVRTKLGNYRGAYKYSNTSSVLHAPSSISLPTSTITNGTIGISWSGVATSSSYTLQESKNNGAWVTITSPSSTSYNRTGRSNGSYKYRIRSCNTYGCSGWRTSGSVTVLLPPPMPASINAPSSTSTNGTLAVSWGSSSTATKYTLQELKAGGSWATISSTLTGTSYSRTGRETGGYNYRIRACNSSGCSSFKTSSTAYVVRTSTNISVPSNDGDGTYSVSWAAVSGATGYQLEQKIGSGSWTSIYSGTGRSKSVSGLGTNTYQYRVKAKYGSVSGSYRTSAATYVVKTPSSISVPSNDGDGAYSISWAAVSGATGYQLEQKVGSGSWASIYSGTSVAKSVSGQTNNTYQYRVKAKYGSVSGGYRTSSVVTVLLPPPVPASITTPTSTVTNGSYTISWPASSTATSYTLAERVNGGSWSYTTVSGLSKSYSGRGNASYQYAVRGCNASACGGWKYSGTFNVLNKPAVPSSITTPSTNYTSSFTVSWPATSTATSYTLAQSVNGASWTHETVSGTSKNYTNRTNATYRYAVRACNTSGCSNYRYSNTFTNTLPPSSISVPASSITGSFTISWAQVSTATSYRLQESVNNGAWSTIASPTAANYSRTGRPNGSYKYQVRACNASGCSAWRASSTLTVLLPPPVPASLSVPTATNTNGVIELAWSASATATEYTLQEQKNGGAWESGTLAATSYTHADRTNGNYIYRVRACNTSGCSDWRTSSTVTVLLPPVVPSTISVPNSTVTDGNIAISWSSVSTATSYTLQQSANNGAWTNLTSQAGTSYQQVVNASGNYRYRVAACNNSGCSPYKTSNQFTVSLPPEAPQNSVIGVMQADGSYLLTWDVVEGAVRYQIIITDANGIEYIYEVDTNQFTLAVPFGEYTVKIKACNVANLCSEDTVAGAVNPTVQVRYQHTDMLGTPVMETDALTNVISRSVYEPFGKRLGGEKPGIGYTGHLQDEDLGLTYMQARYYDPLIGRFYSNDPVGYTSENPVMSFNRYMYVNNNPYKYTDPDGEFALALFVPPPTITGQTRGNVKAPNITKQDVVNSAARTGNPIVLVATIIGVFSESSSEDSDSTEIEQIIKDCKQECIDEEVADYENGKTDKVDGDRIERKTKEKVEDKINKQDEDD